MDNPRRRRITLTQWLLIVIVAALVANAVLQTISIVQHKESARMRAVQRSPKYNAQVKTAPEEERSFPPNSNTRRIERLPYRPAQ